MCENNTSCQCGHTTALNKQLDEEWLNVAAFFKGVVFAVVISVILWVLLISLFI